MVLLLFVTPILSNAPRTTFAKLCSVNVSMEAQRTAQHKATEKPKHYTGIKTKLAAAEGLIHGTESQEKRKTKQKKHGGWGK